MRCILVQRCILGAEAHDAPKLFGRMLKVRA